MKKNHTCLNVNGPLKNSNCLASKIKLLTYYNQKKEYFNNSNEKNNFINDMLFNNKTIKSEENNTKVFK